MKRRKRINAKVAESAEKRLASVNDGDGTGGALDCDRKSGG